MKVKLLIMLVITLLGVFVDASEFVTDGKAAGRILVGQKATETERFAAEELQRACNMISGANMAIAAENGKAGTRNIIIGTPSTCAAIKKLVKKLGLKNGGAEKIAIYVINDKLYLAGNSPRAALYATYTFLDEELGVKWLWPGKDGEFFPKTKNISVKNNLATNQSPALDFRGYRLTYKHRDAGSELWMARNRMNYLRTGALSEKEGVVARRVKMGFHIIFAGHNARLDDKYFKSHPEYFALFNGKRSKKQLCWSSKKAAEIVAQEVCEAWKNFPSLEIVILSASDNNFRCYCDKCKGLKDNELWHQFLGYVIEYARKKYPNGKYGTLAYSNYTEPPPKPAPLDYVEFCAYIDRCYRHNLDCKCNKRIVQQVAEWRKTGIPLAIYGYATDIFVPNNEFVNFTPFFRDQARWMFKNKLKGYSTELTPLAYKANKLLPENKCWNSYRFSLYANARLLWNPEESTDKILKNWCQYVYGPAAHFFENYYRKMGQSWEKPLNHITGIFNLPVMSVDRYITAAVVDEFSPMFKRAEEAVIKNVSDTNKRAFYLEQIELEKKLFDKWMKYYNSPASSAIARMSQLQKGGKLTNLIRNGDFTEGLWYNGSAPTGWYLHKAAKGTITVSDGAARITGQSDAKLIQTVQVKPGDIYVLSTMCRRQGLGNAFIWMLYLDSKARIKKNAMFFYFPPATGEWGKIIGSIEVPDGVSQLKIQLIAQNQLTLNDVICYDNVALYKINAKK